MRSQLFALIALSLLFDTGFAQNNSPEQGSLSGHLYCADSQTSCRFASVTIQSAPPLKAGKPVASNAPSHSYSATTDLDGAYQIKAVAPGQYYVLGKLQGYLSAYDLAVSLYPSSSTLSPEALEIALTRSTVEPGRAAVQDLTLSRGASLGGTLHYDDGSVAINLPVHLFRKDATRAWKLYTNTTGGSVLAPLGLEQHTDDQGRFHEPGLPPGLYTIEVTLPQVTFAPATIMGTPSLTVNVSNGNALRVYNGEKFRLREAIGIELHDGEQRSDIDISLPTHGLHSVRGTVTAGLDRHPLTGGKVNLLDPLDKTLLRSADIQNDGAFTFNYVASETYLISVEPTALLVTDKNAIPLSPLTEKILVETDLPDLHYNLLPAK